MNVLSPFVPVPAAAAAISRSLLIPDASTRIGRLRVDMGDGLVSPFFIGALDEHGKFGLCKTPAEALLVEFTPSSRPHRLKIVVCIPITLDRRA